MMYFQNDYGLSVLEKKDLDKYFSLRDDILLKQTNIEELKRNAAHLFSLIKDLKLEEKKAKEKLFIASFELEDLLQDASDDYRTVLQYLFYWLSLRYTNDQSLFFLHPIKTYPFSYFEENGVEIESYLTRDNVKEFAITDFENDLSDNFIVSHFPKKLLELFEIEPLPSNMYNYYIVIHRYDL
ncbi:hypothetical protein [Flammeovirga aprica]|uniref:Uncharacterized protein n=1 Tax=Flammeovirga aprica JL-4 TaxID=694437 RepID=A0A7X9P2S5_9BACT|nr:hypothetical protein [Flammeovirga aprica]NME68501.1 hypothetical protein [Flammeovirga aprica JL-4]